LFVGVLIFQGVLVITSYPYYLTYYNPVLGGARVAQRIVTIGWGEGLDLAAAYLNQKPNAESLKVTAWHHAAFAPYFRGQSSRDPGQFGNAQQVMSNDYLIIYHHQLQLRIYNPDVLTYFQEHYEPEHVVGLNGVDYALIYAVPIEHHIDQRFSDKVAADKLILYGFRRANPRPGMLSLQLVWENQGVSEEDSLWAALQLPAEDEPRSWRSCTLAPGFSQKKAQQIGSLAESVCEFETGDLEPGIYRLRIGLGPTVYRQGLDFSEYPTEHGAVRDLLAPEQEWTVSVPEAGTPVLIIPGEG
jgi:hypothetical protein